MYLKDTSGESEISILHVNEHQFKGTLVYIGHFHKSLRMSVFTVSTLGVC